MGRCLTCLSWLLIGLGVLVGAARVHATDWPQYFHDPAHTGTNPAETRLAAATLPHLTLIHTVALGNTISGGIPVVNDIAYVGDWNGYLSAIDLTRGTRLWSTFVGQTPYLPACDPPQQAGVSSTPAVLDGSVYVGGGDGSLYALDAHSGAVRWHVPLADISQGEYLWSSITATSGVLYLGIASFGDCPLVPGRVVRVDLRQPTTPLIRYVMAPETVGAGVWSTVAVDPHSGQLFVTTGNGGQNPAGGQYGAAFLALDPTSLAIQQVYFLPRGAIDDDVIEWGASPLAYTSPQGAALVSAPAKNGVVYTLHQADLSVAWTFQVAVGGDSPRFGQGSIATPAYDGRAVYVAGGTTPDGRAAGSVVALAPDSGMPLWVTPLDDVPLTGVSVAHGLVVVPTLAGLRILDAGTGTLLWTEPNGTPKYGPVTVTDGMVVTGDIYGQVSIYGTGTTLAVSLAPTSLRFPSQLVGLASPPQGVTLSNTGSGVVNITGISITGSGDFAQTNTCGSSLTAGASCLITITFTPTARGNRTGTLSITDTAPGSPHTVSLSGTGTTLALTLNQPTFHTGNQLILNAQVTPGPSPVQANVYIALQLPGCNSLACLLFWQGGLNFTTTPQPILRNWTISPFTGPIFSYTFGGMEPVGTYIWLGAFVVPGTVNLIGGITQAPFTFSP